MMSHDLKGLNELLPGDKAIVKKLLKKGSMRRRMQDIGLREGVSVECVGRSPGKDPAAYIIKSAVIAIRDEDSRQVLVEKTEEAD